MERNMPKGRNKSPKNKLVDAVSLVRQKIPPDELYCFTHYKSNL